MIPHSSYYNGPPALDSAYGSDPLGQIGVHYPREILRIERDYSGGELCHSCTCRFHPTFPLELEGRITPVQHQESMNSINEVLISAHSLFPSFVYNSVAILSLYISTLFVSSHYDKEMRRLRLLIDQLNREVYNPQGLNILWPQRTAFLFLEIEYYVRSLTHVIERKLTIANSNYELFIPNTTQNIVAAFVLQFRV
ncbi:Golgin subfamily A member 7/ERF4 family-domain-containing protein [Rhizoctonia solani]|nr:Golgin subfamily A member 7/ERF4 family-domain-containing protein [Rhizoctonia solani]